MTTSMSFQEQKILIVLEYFLSLHEADTLYNLIYDDTIGKNDVLDWLKEFTVSNRDE